MTRDHARVRCAVSAKSARLISQIKRIRVGNNASQAVFAAYLNTNVLTVKKLGRGEKKPHGPSLKLLSLVDSKGQALS